MFGDESSPRTWMLLLKIQLLKGIFNNQENVDTRLGPLLKVVSRPTLYGIS